METFSPFNFHNVKNILIRHACSNQALFEGSSYQHPEKFRILKYFPKYYHNLTLEISSQSPLLSKLKRIKKLKKFTGHLKSNLPQQIWFNLLENNHREIEEIPRISYSNIPGWAQPNLLETVYEAKTKVFLEAKEGSASSNKDSGCNE